MAALPQYHILNFFQDDEGGSALTMLADGTRYHIIADDKHLEKCSKQDDTILREYRKLFHDAQCQEAGNFEEAEDASTQKSESGESEGTHDTQDSGIDMPDRKSKPQASSSENAIEALQNWMVQPLTDILKQEAEKESVSKDKSVQDWYHCATALYSIDIKDGKAVPLEEEPAEDLDKRMAELVPDMPLPKYIKNLKIDMINASDVKILAESTDPEPIHPALVEVKGEKLFLKVVDMNQLQPTKREIKHMRQIEKKGLHKQFRIPLIRGLVHFESCRSSIMGFLMTCIDRPTPLTHLLDPEVPQEKRDRWAAECERIVALLHDNDIVWGDSKADNFMVDANDDLWIIDFGGSYTEGWVDPELNETIEGDDQGVERITNALHDPENNTFSSTEEASSADSEASLFVTEAVVDDTKEKRQREDEEDDEEGESLPNKRSKAS